MHERYVNPEIAKIFSDAHKLQLWQRVELAAISARVQLRGVEGEQYLKIEEKLRANSIDLEEWKRIDREMAHDLNAFVAERRRFIPEDLQYLWHKDMTSYDTEEPAFALMLLEALKVVRTAVEQLMSALEEKARKYRYLPMMARTHGQYAELQSFGLRFLRPLHELAVLQSNLIGSEQALKESKMSGTVGNYTGDGPYWEMRALENLNLARIPVASQIVPRSRFVPLALNLALLTTTADKIALDIRLNSRSGNPLCHEPYGRKQTDSSAMPGKKNPINCEQMGGMSWMAQGYLSMILQTTLTWEERAIEQSCVERVAWPDLFHVTMNALTKMTRVVSGVVVYEGNILEEIAQTRGGYAQSEAKECLKELGKDHGLTAEECYQIIQLALFNIFERSVSAKPSLKGDETDYATAQAFVSEFEVPNRDPADIRDIDTPCQQAFSELEVPNLYLLTHLRDVVAQGQLDFSAQLDCSVGKINKWNDALRTIFSSKKARDDWEQVFDFESLLVHEETIYLRVLEPT